MTDALPEVTVNITTTDDGKVRIDWPGLAADTSWLSLAPDVAIRMAKLLVAKAKEARDVRPAPTTGGST